MGHDGDENDPDNAMENAENREGHIILTDEDVTKRLAQISSKHGLTQEALRDLSELFNQIGRRIPRDPRTILRTNTATVVGDKDFVHIGLVKGLVTKVKKGVHDVPVNINLKILN